MMVVGGESGGVAGAGVGVKVAVGRTDWA